MSNLVAKLLPAFSLTLLLATASAQQPTTSTSVQSTSLFDRKSFEIKHGKFVLDNGLTLLVHEDHSAPVVAVNLWYHVGSRNEVRGKTGFAHLFEHFFFNGSEHHPTGFREAMDDLGANNRNGTTNYDRTNFFEDVPVSALERTLYLEADRMGFLAARISDASLKRERGVVQNEKRQGENQPYGRVYQKISERMYPTAHPYSWSTIGSMEDLDAATLPDIQEWYKTYYGPNNCVLSLAGDITPERALALVKKYFDGVPPGPPLTRTDDWTPRLDANIREQMQDQVPQTRLYRVYHAPTWRNQDIQYLSLLTEVLAGSRSARLDRELIYERKLVTSIRAEVFPSEISSLIVFTATVKEGVRTEDVEAQLDRIVNEIVRKEPTAAEVQRAKARILADFSRGAERLGGFGGRSDILAESMTYDGAADGYLNRLRRIAEARPAEIFAAGKRWLQMPHYTLTVHPMVALKAGPNAVDRKVLPPLAAAPPVAFPAVQRAELANGLKVMLLSRHSVPLVNVMLAIDAGHASDSANRAGVASLALGLLDSGTAKRDTFRIIDDLDALGAQLTTRSTLDLSLVNLAALPRNLNASLDILADVVLHPTFDPSMVEIAKKQRLAQIDQEKAQPAAVAQRILPRLLFGADHAYNVPFSGSGFASTANTVTRDELATWHRTWFHAGNATLIVTGDVTLAQLLPQLERTFGTWSRGKVPVKNIATAQTIKQSTRVYLIDKPGAPQSVIVAAHLSLAGGDPDDLGIDTVMRNFGGISTSRLNRNLRLDKHWSYGANGSLLAARGPRPFIVTAPVQTDKTKEAMVEMIKELRDVASTRPIRGEEYASIMRTQTLGLPGRFATLSAVENAALQILNYGYADDYFATYATRVRALTESDLANAATKFIRPDDVIWIVVGDLSQIESGIRELNLGPIQRLDNDGNQISR